MTNENSRVVISLDGVVMVGEKVVDKLLIMKGAEGSSLIKDFEVYFKSNDGEYVQVDPEEYEIAQGFLESSNVSPINEMESMISLSKNYESAKVF